MMKLIMCDLFGSPSIGIAEWAVNEPWVIKFARILNLFESPDQFDFMPNYCATRQQACCIVRHRPGCTRSAQDDDGERGSRSATGGERSRPGTVPTWLVRRVNGRNARQGFVL
jgi:hypothetical protein